MTTIIPEHRPQPTQEVVKKANHRANIVRVGDILPHGNADTLEIIPVEGYQVVVKKGEFKTGDLAVYLCPDSVVPQTSQFKFIWEPHLVNLGPMTTTDGEKVTYVGLCPEKYRRITVRRFRGQWSEGLLLPLSDFNLLGCHTFYAEPGTNQVNVGDDVSDLLGVTHYDPDKGKESTAVGQSIRGPHRKKRYPRTIRGWINFIRQWFKGDRREHVDFFLPVYDVEALKNYKDAIEPGTPVVITEKIHGSNGRFVFLDGEMYAGSRTLWKSPTSNCTWRKALDQNPWIEAWCRAHEGHALYGEVCPTQKGFDYGCKPGEIKFFVFDIRTPLGNWVDSDSELFDSVQRVPFISEVLFSHEVVQSFVSGQSLVPGSKHIREGVVVKTSKETRKPGVGRLCLKLVSNAFLEKDSK